MSDDLQSLIALAAARDGLREFVPDGMAQKVEATIEEVAHAPRPSSYADLPMQTYDTDGTPAPASTDRPTPTINIEIERIIDQKVADYRQQLVDGVLDAVERAVQDIAATIETELTGSTRLTYDLTKDVLLSREYLEKFTPIAGSCVTRLDAENTTVYQCGHDKAWTPDDEDQGCVECLTAQCDHQKNPET